MQAVPWNRTVVLMKNPQTSICPPVTPKDGAWYCSSFPMPNSSVAKRIGTSVS